MDYKEKGKVSSAKGKLSDGYKTDVYSRLNEIFFDENFEFYVRVTDKYIRQAFISFLEDNSISFLDSDVKDYIFVSVENKTYKYTDQTHGHTYSEIPSEWSLLIPEITSSISNYGKKETKEKISKVVDKGKKLIKNIFKKKEESKQLFDEDKNEHVRVYFIDVDELRYYKGYVTKDGVEYEVTSYDNKVECEINIKGLTIWSEPNYSGVELKIYNSKTDGLLTKKSEEMTKKVLEKSESISKINDQYKKIVEIAKNRKQFNKETGIELGKELIYAIEKVDSEYKIFIQPKATNFDQTISDYFDIPSFLNEISECYFDFDVELEECVKRLHLSDITHSTELQQLFEDFRIDSYTVNEYVTKFK